MQLTLPRLGVVEKLTKTYNISRSQKSSAIKFIPSDDNEHHIVNEGKE